MREVKWEIEWEIPIGARANVKLRGKVSACYTI
jgi:hypothetical protein